MVVLGTSQVDVVYEAGVIEVGKAVKILVHLGCITIVRILLTVETADGVVPVSCYVGGDYFPMECIVATKRVYLCKVFPADR